MAVLQIPLPKTKGTIEVDTDKITNDQLYQHIIIAGLKSVLGSKGFSKFKLKDYRSDDDAIAEAHKLAQTNLEAIYAGDFKVKGAKSAAKRESKEMAEAIRLAKVWVKNQMKALNIRAKDVKAADITKAAKAHVGTNEAHWLAVARESLAKAELESAQPAAAGFDLAKILGATPAPKVERKPPQRKSTAGQPGGGPATKAKPKGGKEAHV